MRGRIKTAIAAGIVAATALTASALAHPGPGDRPPYERGRGRLRHEVCGGLGEAQAAFRAFKSRLVHSESKIQVEGGFALLVVDRGEVASVEGSTLIITRADGEKITVEAAEQTKICLNGKPATLADLMPGYRVGIVQGGRQAEPLVRAIRAFTPEVGASLKAKIRAEAKASRGLMGGELMGEVSGEVTGQL